MSLLIVTNHGSEKNCLGESFIQPRRVHLHQGKTLPTSSRNNQEIPILNFFFFKHVANALLRQFKHAKKKDSTTLIPQKKSMRGPDGTTIWIQVSYAGNASEAIMKRLISKFQRCCKDKVYFKVL